MSEEGYDTELECSFKEQRLHVWTHYTLFHVAEGMNPVRATFWVVMNVFGNAYKKMLL